MSGLGIEDEEWRRKNTVTNWTKIEANKKKIKKKLLLKPSE